MKAALTLTLIATSTNSINLRRRTTNPIVNNVGTSNPILPQTGMCLGDKYPLKSDGCGTCICETADYENDLLKQGVNEYASDVQNNNDDSTWALPQKMEERCLKYLHSLSVGIPIAPTLFIENRRTTVDPNFNVWQGDASDAAERPNLPGFTGSATGSSATGSIGATGAINNPNDWKKQKDASTNKT